jgi:H+/Cl- antiporter ClcA
MADGLPDTALWLILLFPMVKIAATSLSIGSGGSGGIFGPGMVIGGFVASGCGGSSTTSHPACRRPRRRSWSSG